MFIANTVIRLCYYTRERIVLLYVSPPQAGKHTHIIKNPLNLFVFGYKSYLLLLITLKTNFICIF